MSVITLTATLMETVSARFYSIRFQGKSKLHFFFFFSEAEAATVASANFSVDAFGLLICQEANHLHPHYLLPAIDY